MNNVCYIISAGECAGINIKKNNGDYIIAVDGGYQHALDNDIVPDMILGDFDSLGYIPEGDNVVRHETEKDDTDTMLAVYEAVNLGYKKFRMYGALGGRLDHTLANLQALTYLSKKGLKGSIFGGDAFVTAVTNGRIVLPKQSKGRFSVFTQDTEAKGVSITGAKYEIFEQTLYNDKPLGISNEFVGNKVEISVKVGTLLILVDKV